MSSIDESIEKILLKLQREDPETFRKLLKRVQKKILNFLRQMWIKIKSAY